MKPSAIVLGILMCCTSCSGLKDTTDFVTWLFSICGVTIIIVLITWIEGIKYKNDNKKKNKKK